VTGFIPGNADTGGHKPANKNKGGYTMKRYNIYKSGSTVICTINAKTILQAANQFCRENGLDATLEKYSDDYYSIRLKGNYSIMSDYLIMSA